MSMCPPTVPRRGARTLTAPPLSCSALCIPAALRCACEHACTCVYMCVPARACVCSPPRVRPRLPPDALRGCPPPCGTAAPACVSPPTVGCWGAPAPRGDTARVPHVGCPAGPGCPSACSCVCPQLPGMNRWPCALPAPLGSCGQSHQPGSPLPASRTGVPLWGDTRGVGGHAVSRRAEGAAVATAAPACTLICPGRNISSGGRGLRGASSNGVVCSWPVRCKSSGQRALELNLEQLQRSVGPWRVCGDDIPMPWAGPATSAPCHWGTPTWQRPPPHRPSPASVPAAPALALDFARWQAAAQPVRGAWPWGGRAMGGGAGGW